MKPEDEQTMDQALIDEVFSWSLGDVLNRNYYNHKVAEIPTTFPSVSHYCKSFVYPLYEETHAQLLSTITGVNRSPFALIVKVRRSKVSEHSKSFIYSILLEKRKGCYEPEVGDLIALTDVRPKCVDDLQRPNKSYLIALVQSIKEYKTLNLYRVYILSSKPIFIPEDVVKGDINNVPRSFIEDDVKRFVVYLMNLITNIRISNALHSGVVFDKKKMIDKVLQADYSVEENCAECYINTIRDETLLKTRETLKTFHLDGSQEAAVLSCVAERECRHQNTIKLIWGPPGTGKTKTVGLLLFMLLGLKCRTLTCAPTNTAVLGVTQRVMTIVRDHLKYDTYGLGDMVLFGNEKRMKIDDCQDLLDIFLHFRVQILSDCLTPGSGWKGSSEWMLSFLENPEVQYELYIKQHLEDDERKSDDKNADNRNEEGNKDNTQLCIKKDLTGDGDSDGYSDFSDEEDESDSGGSTFEEENLRTEKEEVKEALTKKNWKTFILRPLKDNKEVRIGETMNEGAKEHQSNQKSEEKKFQENILTFEEFVIKGFNFLCRHLVSCIENLYTHMPTSFVSVEEAKQMIAVAHSLKNLGELLQQSVTANVGLREALNGMDDDRTGGSNNLHTCRMSNLEILKDLQDTLCFPRFEDKFEIKKFCLANACLIFCTASSSSNLHTEREKPLEFLVIDEAGQLKECESLIPLQLEGLRHAILVGDERQLPAMVQSKLSEEAHFGRSLFERLVSLGHKKHLLNVQYRMHPSISQFPNCEFYDKQILDGPNVKSSTYDKCFLQGSMYGSYSFINVTSAKEEFDKSHSTRNPMEVAIVSAIIARLFKESVSRKQRVSVGCISPYKAQVNAIQEILGKKYMGSESHFTVSVRSVDGFQGSEEDVIIISTVRCNDRGSVGFLSNHQRANVALTRARYCLWILGNEPTLVNSGSIWKNLVVDAKDRGCFYNAREDKSLVEGVMAAMTTDLGQPNSLLSMYSLIFSEAKWQVKFSDTFLEKIARFSDPEDRKKVISLLIKLSSGWRQPVTDRNITANTQGTCLLLEEYDVTQDLRLIWAVDLEAQSSICIQVLKIWDVLPAAKVNELSKILMEKVYGNYTVNMISRCKETHVEGNLTLPITWPMNSNTDSSWSLTKQLAALSLSSQPASSSSSRTGVRGFGNRKSNRYGDLGSRGRERRW